MYPVPGMVFPVPVVFFFPWNGVFSSREGVCGAHKGASGSHGVLGSRLGVLGSQPSTIASLQLRSGRVHCDRVVLGILVLHSAAVSGTVLFFDCWHAGRGPQLIQGPMMPTCGCLLRLSFFGLRLGGYALLMSKPHASSIKWST